MRVRRIEGQAVEQRFAAGRSVRETEQLSHRRQWPRTTAANQTGVEFTVVCAIDQPNGVLCPFDVAADPIQVLGDAREHFVWTSQSQAACGVARALRRKR